MTSVTAETAGDHCELQSKVAGLGSRATVFNTVVEAAIVLRFFLFAICLLVAAHPHLMKENACVVTAGCIEANILRKAQS
jgi:hypothetical protein